MSRVFQDSSSRSKSDGFDNLGQHDPEEDDDFKTPAFHWTTSKVSRSSSGKVPLQRSKTTLQPKLYKRGSTVSTGSKSSSMNKYFSRSARSSTVSGQSPLARGITQQFQSRSNPFKLNLNLGGLFSGSPRSITARRRSGQSSNRSSTIAESFIYPSDDDQPPVDDGDSEAALQALLGSLPFSVLEDVLQAAHVLVGAGVTAVSDVKGLQTIVSEMVHAAAQIPGRSPKKYNHFFGGKAAEFERATNFAWYTEKQGLEIALSSDATVMLHSEWMVDCAEQDRSMPRRQDLPCKAFWDNVAELYSKLEISRCDPNYIAVSMGWLSSDHPDPEGEQLRILSSALRLTNKDSAVFWEWGSLYQLPRTAWEEDSFKCGIKNMHYLFASRLVWKLLLTDVPSMSTAAVPYDQCGWKSFESLASGMITDSDMVLDLGSIEEFPDCLNELKMQCAAKRSPPLAPDAFQTFILQKHFTNTSDALHLVEVYRRMFNDIVGAVERLFFNGCDWEDFQVACLADALRAVPQPPALKLQELWLVRNHIGDEGTFVLSALMMQGYVPALSCLLLDSNHIGPDGVHALMGAFDRHTALSKLGLQDNDLDEVDRAEARTACLRRDITLHI